INSGALQMSGDKEIMKILGSIKPNDDREALLEAGRAVGKAIQARIAANREQAPKRGNRRSGGHYRKWPDTPREFIAGGGMRHIEAVRGARGRDEAILYEREFWLPQLECWHAEAQGFQRGVLGGEIKRLRRCLNIKPSADIVRAQTRERVRRLRAR